MTKRNWAGDQAGRIATAMRQLRGRRSGQWLSDETAKAGHRISRTTISELESGKRKAVTTAELCVLAQALNVPPIRLLYPDLPDGPVEVVPGLIVPSIDAAAWFSGETVLSEPEHEPARVDRKGVNYRLHLHYGPAVSRGDQLVDLARERAGLEQRIRSLVSLAARLKAEDPTGAKALVDDIAGAESRIKAINGQLQEIEGAVVHDEAVVGDGR